MRLQKLHWCFTGFFDIVFPLHPIFLRISFLGYHTRGKETSIRTKNTALYYMVGKSFLGKRCKNRKKVLDGFCGVCYIMTVAPMRQTKSGESRWNQQRRRMYPENYTMQNSWIFESNKPDATSLWRWKHLRSTKQQFFYKNDILSQQALHISGEFDPGSGRTLAACLTHASRTGWS